MNGESLIEQLLQEALDSNRTPDEVCGEHPEHLWEVRERWRRCRKVEAQLEAIFPSSHGRSSGGSFAQPLSAELPRVPGYEVEAILGHGGMGVVYKARQLNLNRPVALKMLLAGAFAARPEITRFLREAEVVAGLRHPNVVPIYESGDFEGRPYFTMEFVEGGNLATKLAGIPQPSAQAAAMMVTLARAVEAAHQAGIVHRDLKPANILLTADGTPKIGDFGLARHFEGEHGSTLTGAPVGTPSYMAPEQATGRPSLIGPPADIYSLGAILYELLTGRPPFRGETASETERQVINDDPVPPSRLNGKVPRDLETICLKCLHKDPARRYPTAAALVADIERFQNGEPIMARRVGPIERIGKWVRRRPALASLLASMLLLTTLLIGGSIWLAVQNAKRQQAVDSDFREIASLQEQARWTDAMAVLQRVEARLNGKSAETLRRRLNEARSDLDLVARLDKIRLNRETSAGYLAYYKTKADREYLTAFENSGLANVQDSSDVVAARVTASAVRAALIAALDDWAVCAADKTRRDWLLAIARESDRDPLGWSDRIRASATWDDLTAISQLSETVPVKGQSVSLLLALGERLRAAGGDGTAFLKRVQKDHPADFWANIVLGNALVSAAPDEAAGYYRAALSSRPEAPVAYTALGDALRLQGKGDEANGYYRQALVIDPNYARGHTNLGNFLSDMSQRKEAIECFRTAIKVDPNYAWAHLGLANSLSDAGQAEEALDHYRAFQSLGPPIPHVANILRSDLVRRGRGNEARLEWKKSLALDPPHHDAWFGYAELCLFLGDEDEYRRAVKDLSRRFGNTGDSSVAEKTARAILLAPPSDEDLKTAIVLADRAVAARSTTPDWIYPYFLFAKGLAEFRQGHFESAISIMDSEAAAVMGPCPRLVLAMAKYRLGDEEESRAVLAKAISAADWSVAEVRSHDQWIWHVLRREAEAVILWDKSNSPGNHRN